MSITTSHDFIDEALESVTDMVDETPEFKNLGSFLGWFASLITALTVAINSIALNIHRRLQAVESSSSAPTTVSTAPSVTVTQGSTKRDTAEAAQRQARCTQCHA